MCHLFQQLTAKWKLQCLPLALVTPVPADIVIARSQQPKPISDLANQIGLLTNEVCLYTVHEKYLVGGEFSEPYR